MAVTCVADRKQAEARLGLSSEHISIGGTIEYAEMGRYVKVQLKSGGIGRKKKKGKRSIIHGFTHGSRTRMQQKMAQLPENGVLPLMLTLTYHRKWPDTGEEWKEHVDRFIKRFEHHYGQHAMIWRMEYQERGAPHFHLLVFIEEDVDIPLVKRIWHEIAGYGSPEHAQQGVNRIERIRSWRGVSNYTSKYIAKWTQSGQDDNANGRHWGVRRWYLLAVRLIKRLVTQREALRLKWLLEAYQLSNGYKPRFRFPFEGLWTYLDSANVERLLAYVEKEASGAILADGGGGP